MYWKNLLPESTEIEYWDWPTELEISHYSKASADVINIINQSCKNTSVYQTGEISKPGISDLDFLIILNDEKQKHKLNHFGYLRSSLPPLTQYLLIHNPLMILNPSLWQNINKLYTYKNFIHLSGPLLKTPDSADDSGWATSLLQQVEQYTFRPMKKNFNQIFTRKISMRRALVSMNTIKYSVNAVQGLGIEIPKWLTFNNDVTELRNNWFSFEKHQQITAIYQLTRTGIEICFEIMEKLSELLEKFGLIPPELETTTGKKIVGYLDDDRIFVKGFQSEQALEFYIKAFHLTGNFISLIPSNFLLPLMVYSDSTPYLRDYFRDRIAVHDPILDNTNFPVRMEINDRVKFSEQYLKFIKEENLDWGFYKHWVFRRGMQQNNEHWHSMIRILDQVHDYIPLYSQMLLVDKQSQIEEIFKSPTWKAGILLRKFRTKIAPENSLRNQLFLRIRKTIYLLLKKGGIN